MNRYVHPNESESYRKQREELLQAEIALKEQRERVAALRRALPRDTLSEDYRLQVVQVADGGPVRECSLSELFDDPAKPLVLVHYMFGKAQTDPCPMCMLWADGYDGAVPHLLQHVNFGVLVAGDLDRFRSFGRERGWRNLRLISAADSTIKRDLSMEGSEGQQLPGVSVYTLGGDGRVRHFYTGSAIMTDEHHRGMDLLSPVWNFLDLTPGGRGDWWPQVRY